MNREWSLDELYSGYNDKKFIADFEELEKKLNGFSDIISKAEMLPGCEGLEFTVTEMESIISLVMSLNEYVGFRNSTDTADSETNNWMTRIDNLMAAFSSVYVSYQKYVAAKENLEDLIRKSALLTEYEYHLRHIKQDAKHLMSDELEDMAAHMDLTGGGAWGKLFNYLTSSLKVDYRGSQITLSDVRNLASDKEREVRKDAYEAELAAYDKIADSIAFALNNIKSQVNYIAGMRGFENPLAMTVEQCDMKMETLEAMLTAMKEYLPKFWKYMRAKASLLGYEGGLPWYEVIAPVADIQETYTAEQARDVLVESFSGFCPELADMIARAFDESWIDFYPHDGKVGGAFCGEIAAAKQSRILTNFNGSFDSVVTLAHELGHAFHNQQVFDNRIMNRDYSMPVAETASIFNETYFMLSAYEKTDDTKEKLSILENMLSGTNQIICDIYSRFLFEDAVFRRCKDEFLMTKDLKEIMLDAQRQAYGSGLDENFMHPYMWTCKGHYYSSGLSYYNFPYAFGGLFAMGLYAEYQKKGSSFVPEYKALLKATATGTVEDTARMAGIDLTKPDFWRSSLEYFADLIDKYEEIVKEITEIKA